MKKSGFIASLGALIALVAVSASVLIAQKGQPKFDTWRAYLGGADSSQYSSLDQINRKNVAQLQVVWTYSPGDQRTYRFNPIVVDGVMYTLGKANLIVRSTRRPAKSSGFMKTRAPSAIAA